MPERLAVWKLTSDFAWFQYSRMSSSPSVGHCPDAPFDQKAGHTPQPCGVCVKRMAVRK